MPCTELTHRLTFMVTQWIRHLVLTLTLTEKNTTSEFIAEESNEKFWHFLETVQELTIYKQRDSEISYYNLILKKAGQFLSSLQINLLKFALSIRAYSPTVQMFQQIAADESPPEGCSAFVVIHEKRTCKTNEIKKLLKKAAER
nr:UDP-glucose:glycoprotein glucosyltransferase 2-like [Pelodiscus sinensis]|eukprot:XP_025038706.1 UDP-glucose:glycoprotein glucosyltransferase 2-like [Pelodiscus sinensis]